VHNEFGDTKLLYTEAELQALGLGSRSTLRKYKMSGQLVPLKLGKMIRYRKEDVLAFIERQVGVEENV
jgi:hypothetical protein